MKKDFYSFEKFTHLANVIQRFIISLIVSKLNEALGTHALVVVTNLLHKIFNILFTE